LPNTVLNSPKLIQGLLEGVSNKASTANVVQITSMGHVSWHYNFNSDTVFKQKYVYSELRRHAVH
jgi:hypothetical protein